MAGDWLHRGFAGRCVGGRAIAEAAASCSWRGGGSCLLWRRGGRPCAQLGGEAEEGGGEGVARGSGGC